MYEADGVPGSDGSISEGLSDEAPHADRSDEQDVLVAVQEQGEGGVEESSVECDGCGPEVFEAAGLEAGPLEAELDRLWSLRLISSVRISAGRMRSRAAPCVRERPSPAGCHGAELEALEQRGEFSRGGHERSPCAE